MAAWGPATGWTKLEWSIRFVVIRFRPVANGRGQHLTRSSSSVFTLLLRWPGIEERMPIGQVKHAFGGSVHLPRWRPAVIDCRMWRIVGPPLRRSNSKMPAVLRGSPRRGLNCHLPPAPAKTVRREARPIAEGSPIHGASQPPNRPLADWRRSFRWFALSFFNCIEGVWAARRRLPSISATFQHEWTGGWTLARAPSLDRT